jgi:hypothetical protein
MRRQVWQQTPWLWILPPIFLAVLVIALVLAIRPRHLADQWNMPALYDRHAVAIEMVDSDFWIGQSKDELLRHLGPPSLEYDKSTCSWMIISKSNLIYMLQVKVDDRCVVTATRVVTSSE